MLGHVVYLLGAGFSAPLGLPVMSDFLMRAKDLYFEKQPGVDYFKEIFDTIEDLSGVRKYFEADIHNIEEILSLLEMGDFVEGEPSSQKFIRFLADVITGYTPTFETSRIDDRKWKSADSEFGSGVPGRYATFLAGLLGQDVVREGEGRFTRFLRQRAAAPDSRYSIISLNYDMVIEESARMICKACPEGDPQPLCSSPTQMTEDSVAFGKLHGSVDGLTIVPPTFSKGSGLQVREAWKLAWDAFASANEIRILGYSLPLADSNVRYLLKSATRKAPNLQRIDVVCMDADGGVRERYDEFLDFFKYRFSSSDVLELLKGRYESTHVVDDLHTRRKYSVEPGHELIEWDR